MLHVLGQQMILAQLLGARLDGVPLFQASPWLLSGSSGSVYLIPSPCWQRWGSSLSLKHETVHCLGWRKQQPERTGLEVPVARQ